jgi:hypothetical protein
VLNQKLLRKRNKGFCLIEADLQQQYTGASSLLHRYFASQKNKITTEMVGKVQHESIDKPANTPNKPMKDPLFTKKNVTLENIRTLAGKVSTE